MNNQFLNINTVLINHIASHSGVAAELRYRKKENISIEEFIKLLIDFFDTRTDAKRLANAQSLGEAILKMNDMEDLAVIRDIVARQELLRNIKYKKQQDHSAHTLYLFFLGIWMYDNIEIIRNKIKIMHDDNFLFHWLYASLLHDIGYAFYDLSEETKADRKIIENMYSIEFLKKNIKYDERTRNTQQAISNAWTHWNKRFNKTIHNLSITNSPSVILDVLSDTPWVGTLNPKWKKINNSFELFGKRLKNYAYEVARTGYNENQIQAVDHAVASGLLLFQYSSYYYYIINHAEKEYPGAAREIAPGFNYGPQNMNGIFMACKAAAYHNVLSSVLKPNHNSVNIINKISLSNEPLTFLAVLCDELQRWDRFAAGEEYLNDFKSFAIHQLEAPDVMISVSEFNRLIFTIRHSDDIHQKIIENLKNRLPSWREIGDIEHIKSMETSVKINNTLELLRKNKAHR